jgi:hypothetical protein
MTATRKAGVAFKNASFSTALWARYCAQPQSWSPEIMPSEGSE